MARGVPRCGQARAVHRPQRSPGDRGQPGCPPGQHPPGTRCCLRWSRCQSRTARCPAGCGTASLPRCRSSTAGNAAAARLATSAGRILPRAGCCSRPCGVPRAAGAPRSRCPGPGRSRKLGNDHHNPCSAPTGSAPAFIQPCSVQLDVWGRIHTRPSCKAAPCLPPSLALPLPVVPCSLLVPDPVSPDRRSSPRGRC